jgi:multidrug efflux pump subunit AcrA (membrane-fusion protein)
MTATVDVVTFTKDNTLLIPRDAVRTEDNRTSVMVYTPNGQAPSQWVPAHEERDVTLGLVDGDRVEIVNGVQAGEDVLIYTAPAPETGGANW